MEKQTIAKLNYLHITPRKVRLIADTLKGLPVREAEAQLLFRVQRSARPLLKLLRSAIANAKNSQIDTAKLFVKSIRVDQGPVLKRSLPRAQGRATPILKRMSQVTVVLEEAPAKLAERFVIAPPVKKEKARKGAKKPKIEVEKKEQVAKKPGFFRRLFRRKSV